MAAEKIALITGANKGIGFEIARQLSQQGTFVLIWARDAARGKEAAALLTADGLAVAALSIDVTDPASVAWAARDIEEQHGRLDYRTVEQAAVVAVRLATLGADGPTGTFQDENGAVPW